MQSPPALQTKAGPGFGTGEFQPDNNVTVHSVSNLAEGLRAKVRAECKDAHSKLIASDLKCTEEPDGAVGGEGSLENYLYPTVVSFQQGSPKGQALPLTIIRPRAQLTVRLLDNRSSHLTPPPSSTS